MKAELRTKDICVVTIDLLILYLLIRKTYFPVMEWLDGWRPLPTGACSLSLQHRVAEKKNTNLSIYLSICLYPLNGHIQNKQTKNWAEHGHFFHLKANWVGRWGSGRETISVIIAEIPSHGNIEVHKNTGHLAVSTWVKIYPKLNTKKLRSKDTK